MAHTSPSMVRLLLGNPGTGATTTHYWVTVVVLFPVGRNLRRRHPFRANAYHFQTEEENMDWVEYRFRLVIQKMAVVILILLIVLLFQLYPVKKQQ